MKITNLVYSRNFLAILTMIISVRYANFSTAPKNLNSTKIMLICLKLKLLQVVI